MAKKAHAGGTGHVAVRIEVQRLGDHSDCGPGAIDLAEFGPDALPIGLLGLRSVLNAGTAQSLNHQAGGVVRAGPDPSRRVPRDTLVFGRESLSRGTGAVEDHRRCSVQVLAEEAWTFFFLRFAREIAQEFLGSRA